MSLKIGFLLLFGLANQPLQSRAMNEKKTCPAHEQWTVFQRRMNGKVDFFRGWDDYVNGFGDCEGDFWLGLESLHQLTKGDDMSLEINMMSKGKKDHLVARYSTFRIGPGSDNYRRYISGYSENEVLKILDGDFVLPYLVDAYSERPNIPRNVTAAYPNGSGEQLSTSEYGDGYDYYAISGDSDAFVDVFNPQFSTYDADHDNWSLSCALEHESAWWYGYGCDVYSNLNGHYNRTDEKGIWWWPNYDVTGRSLCCSEMKIYKRPEVGRH